MINNNVNAKNPPQSPKPLRVYEGLFTIKIVDENFISFSSRLKNCLMKFFQNWL